MKPPANRYSRQHVISRDEPLEPTITVATKCPMCAAPGSLVVSRTGYFHWLDGGSLLQWLPNLDWNQRQQLLSGICEPCWVRIFEDGEEGARRLVDFLVAGVARRCAKGAAT
jgi:hypothetical protein